MSRSRLRGASASLSVALLAGFWLALAPPARAAEPTSQPLPERIAAQATAVVLGTATAADSLWLEGQLVTLVQFSVEEHLLGSTADDIVILTAGGVDMNRRIPVAAVVPGEARLEPGDHVVVYLRPAEGVTPLQGDLYVVVGGEQGEIAASALEVAP